MFNNSSHGHVNVGNPNAALVNGALQIYEREMSALLGSQSPLEVAQIAYMLRDARKNNRQWNELSAIASMVEGARNNTRHRAANDLSLEEAWSYMYHVRQAMEIIGLPLAANEVVAMMNQLGAQSPHRTDSASPNQARYAPSTTPPVVERLAIHREAGFFSDTLFLKWAAPDSAHPVIGYRLQWKGVGAGKDTEWLVEDNPDGTPWPEQEFHSVDKFVRFAFRVQARTDAGWGPWSRVFSE